MTELRSAIVVVVPEAPAGVAHWLEATAGHKPSRGVPPHVTILFPFVPASALERALDRVAAIAARHEPFSFELRETARWPGVLVLAPEPPEPFVALTEAFVAAYPEHPPYESAHDAVVPHLTVALGDDETLTAATETVLPALPIRARAHELVLLAEREPDAWETAARIPLGGRT